jgi:hypothetical protein
MDKVEQWHLQRRGKFTASEMYKLLIGAKNGGMFGDVATGYIEAKAIEMTSAMWDRPELEETKSILHGRVHEYPAYQMYVQVTKNFSMEYIEPNDPVFLLYDALPNECGGTPDCVSFSKSGTVEFGAEIKCPVNPAYHFRRLKWKDQWDVKENYPLVYAQIQTLLMITKAQEWHFVSFDDRQLYKPSKIKIIPVLPDIKFQNNLEVRLRQAIKEKYRMIGEHHGLKIRNREDFARIFGLEA